jgi:hypothetical protein
MTLQRGVGQVTGPQITLTATSIAENAANGTAIGTLGVAGGIGVYTFTVESDPDAVFDISGGALDKDGTLDYETATSHQVQIKADNGAGSVIYQWFTIGVTNVAPVLSNATDTATGQTTATITVDTTESNGTLYWVVTTSATPPTAAQVKTGKDNAGAAAAASGTQAISSTGTKTVSVTGLTASTTYTAHFMHEETSATQSNVASGNGLTTTGTFAGAGDVVTTAAAWFGLRAYNAAAVGTNCIRLVRASDSAQSDFVTLADGSLDVASIATWMTATTAKVVTLYDQTGNSKDVTQGTDANRPAFILNALGSLPCIRFLRASSTSLRTTVNMSSDTQPWTYSVVVMRTGSFTLDQAVFATGITSGALSYVGWANSANTARLYSGSSGTTAMADSAVHAIQAVANGASSILYIDGASNTVSSGTRVMDDKLDIGGNDGFADYFTGDFFEGGVWNAGFDATQQSNMNANQHAYWGF